MRIGLVTEHYDRHGGGLEQWTAQFAEEIAARGHELHVVARRFRTPSPGMAHAIAEARGRVAFARGAERVLRQLDLDIVHDTGAGWHCDVYQPHFGSRRATTMRKVELLPRALRPIKRVLIKVLPRYRRFEYLADRQLADDGRVILALSQRVADDLVQFDRVRRDQIRIIPNGVDTDRFAPDAAQAHRDRLRRELGISEGTCVALIVAHNFRLKGVPAAIRAVGRLATEGHAVHLVVVGGRRLRQYRRLARYHKTPATFVGSVGDTVPYYAAADVYVHPTHYDACSLVVLEAMAVGLPVITTLVNGAGELMRDSQHGYLLPDPHDDQRLSDVLRRLLDGELRRRMGRAARELMLDRTLKENADAIEALYEEILAARRTAVEAKQAIRA